MGPMIRHCYNMKNTINSEYLVETRNLVPEELLGSFKELLIAYHTEYKQYLDEGEGHPGERAQTLLDGSSRSFVAWVLINIENKTLLL